MNYTVLNLTLTISKVVQLLRQTKAPSTLIRINFKAHKMFSSRCNPETKTDKMFSVHTETVPLPQKRLNAWYILVPRAHDPQFGQHQGLRPLAGSNTGSPRYTDSLSNLTNLIGLKYNTSPLRMLTKSGPARGLDFWG